MEPLPKRRELSKAQQTSKPPSRDRDIGRRYEDGATKARKRKVRETFLATQKGSLDKFTKIMNNSLNVELSTCTTIQHPKPLQPESPSLDMDITEFPVSSTIETSAHGLFSQPPPSLNTTRAIACSASNENSSFSEGSKPSLPRNRSYDLSDPGKWPACIERDPATRIHLVENGPPKIPTNYTFPRDGDGRHFSLDFRTCTLVNGEKSVRSWLVYSKSKDAIFCFCCRLFGTGNQTSASSLSKADGFRDWNHCGRSLKSHQRSPEHIKSFTKWTELHSRIQQNSTIDQEHVGIINAEKKHWEDVLTRIIAAVKYLAETNSAFRGSSSKLYENNNGNFLKLMEMLASFDGPMREHLRRIHNEKTRVHYLGPETQNEIISMLGTATKEKILDAVRSAKYYAVILDCTPDVSHKEQMTLILRYVDMMETPQVVEKFIEFLEVGDTTGEGLTEVLKSTLEANNINIMDCRGQGYDNGANMKAKLKGVQTRVKKLNKRAMFTACVAHNLNLLLGDMAKCNKEAMTFFGLVQRIYTLFVASTERWNIFLEHSPGLTLKSLSKTRWECRIDSVKPIRYQLGNINSALEKVAETTNDSVARSEAQSLLHHTSSYEFILSLIIWHDLLHSVNATSKTVQSESITLDTALNELRALKSFLENYRKIGFKGAICTAREIMENLDYNMKFSIRRKLKPTRFFDEKQTKKTQEIGKTKEELQREAENEFRVNYFLPVVDQALSCIESRFNEVECFAQYFGFIFTPSKLLNLEEKELEDSCRKLSDFLKDGQLEDLDGNDLFSELKLFKYAVPSSVDTALSALRYLAPVKESYPNLTTAYRILLTIPVTVASGERSFSILKLIKNYLRSTMAQERLNGLATLSIESEVAKKLEMEDLISSFAFAKVRKVPFK